jgi:hypothetical protein
VRNNIFIKYVGVDENDSSNIDLKILGESLQGFDHLLREILEVFRIDSRNVEIRAQKVSDGSIVINVLIDLISNTPFSTFKALLDFHQFVNSETYELLLAQGPNLKALHADLNSLVASNPLDMYLLSKAIRKAFKLIKDQKNVLKLLMKMACFCLLSILPGFKN